MVQYGEDFVNLFAPNLWELSIDEIPKIDESFPEAHLAMWNVAARELFNGEWKPLVALAVRQFMRRSILAVSLYEDGRKKLEEFSFNHRRDRPNLKAYFGALDAFEGCILQLDFCVENLRHVLESEDAKNLLGSTRSLSELCKSIRHSGARAKGSEQSKSRKLFPVFFENCGVTNGKEGVTFGELRDLANDFASLTSRIFHFDASKQDEARVHSPKP